MSFLIKDKNLSEKYNVIWKKISNFTKSEFENNPVYNEKYVKTEIKSSNWKLTQILTKIKYQKKALNVFVHQ